MLKGTGSNGPGWEYKLEERRAEVELEHIKEAASSLAYWTLGKTNVALTSTVER